MGQFLKFTNAEHESAAAHAAERQLRDSRRRAYLGSLARQTFVAWARQEGLPVSLEGTYAADADLAELLDIADVRVDERRLDIRPLHESADPYLRADRRSIAAGLHADAYVYVELAADLKSGRVAGLVPLEAFVERAWLDPDGEHLVVDREELRDLDEFGALLASAPTSGDRVVPAQHEEVFDGISAFEGGYVALEDRAPFESHLFGCAECRRELVRVRHFRDVLVAREVPARREEAGSGEIVAFSAKPDRKHPDWSYRRIREAAALIAADAQDRFELEGGGGRRFELTVPNERSQPRIDEAGISGVLLLRDTALAKREVRAWLLLEGDDGTRAEPWTLVVEGRKLVLSGGLPGALRASLAAHVGGETLALRPEWLKLRLAEE